MTFDDHMTAAANSMKAATVEYDKETVRADTAEVECARLAAENAALKELLEQGGGGSLKPPAILDETFTNGVDWHRFFAEEGDDNSDRQKFTKTPDGLSCVWTCGNPSGSVRSELGIRRDPGGGETPRRDPIDSERWYRYDFLIPESYKLDDAEADHKRVLFQNHQSGSGITNPPISLELRNGTLRLVRSVGDQRENIFQVPCVKGVVHTLIYHILWHGSDGWIETWMDTLVIPRKACRTCTASGDGMNNKAGSYQPGAKNGDFPNGYRLEHFITRWAIGDETNTLEEMRA
jgi:hypothetical protein